MANWTTLFASPANCECKDCNSIFSPAAYLVDIMQYLDHCDSKGAGGKSVLQVLFERRPDIGNLLLTCENTNTEIPYIDLVNEIMEYYIAYSIHTDTNTANQNIATLIVADDTPVVTGIVTNGKNQMSLSVSSSKIISVNFKIGDAIIIDGTQYTINSVPANLNTSTITFNLNQPFAATNATLQAFSIRFNYPTGDTGNASAQELKAEPQYMLLEAYKQVYQKVYPFNLPYNQPLDVIRAYLKFLKTSRAELMEVFGKYPVADNNNPPNITNTAILQAAIDAEWMQLSLNEYETLTGSDFLVKPISPQPNVEDYFGKPRPQYTGTGIPVKDFLQRTGLKYTDLLNILEARFINPGQDAWNVLQNILVKSPSTPSGDFYLALQSDYEALGSGKTNDLSATIQILSNAGITSLDDLNKFKEWLIKNFTAFQQTITLYEPTSACDLDKTLLHSIQWLYENKKGNNGFSAAGSDPNIDLDFLSKLHRFIRLWHKRSWSTHELDNLIVALGETDITTTLIGKLALVTKVNGILKLPLLQLACLWGNMDTQGNNSANFPKNISLYAQLFLKSTGSVTGSPTQNPNIFAPNPLNKVFTSSTTTQISDHLPEIFAALSISADDYNVIIADAEPANNNVTLENLSLLYRYRLLADVLNLSVLDLCTLKSVNCFNVNPFSSPGNTLDFIEKVQKFQDAHTTQTSLTVPLLNYILAGSSKPIDNIALSQDTIFKTLPELRSALLKIDNDNPASDANIITTDLLSKKLMLLYSKDIADQFILMLKSSIPSASVAVPDLSYTISDASKYSYTITLVSTSLTGKFQQGELIIDSNKSTASIESISDTKLTLSQVKLISPNNSLTGTITGTKSNATATVVSFTILFQLTGFMTDDEYSKISSAGLTTGFKNAVDNLHQQSLTALNEGIIIVAPQVICVKATDPQTVFKIPPTLSAKYFYFLSETSWLLQCKGIMSDDEYNQLGSEGNAQFQSAVKYIYTYPSTFLENNFTGLYDNTNIKDALQNLFGLLGNPINDLTGKLHFFYKAFLPFLVAQLKQRQTVSLISSLIDLDVQSVSAITNSNINTLVQTASEMGLDANYYNNPKLTNDPIIKTDKDINFSWGNTSPVASANFSVQWKGWLSPATDGDYIFTTIAADTSDQVNLLVNGLKTAINTGVSLVGGQLYTIELYYIHTSGNSGVQLFWQSAAVPPSIIHKQFLYSGTNVQTLLQQVLLYHSAAQAITGFALSASEVSYFINNPSDFGGLNFLPVTNIQWLRIYDYCTIRKIIPGKLLLSIFQKAAIEASADTVPSDDLITIIANANQPKWNKDYLSFLAGNSGTKPPSSYFGYKAKDFKNEIALLQIKKAIDLAIKTKMRVNSSGLPAWTVIETDPSSSIDLLHPVAKQIKNAVKAKYKDNWLTIATQLNNPIRENQKQALISYLLTLQLPAPDGSGSDGSGKVADADGLFEYLLIDVQMTSAVATSRLIQSTLAVQLFADRCLLGLETEVPLSSNAIKPDEWDWMKHYSVAAGLKKLLAYVENYLEPSLRDDKSPFFLDFESAIKKGDITDENVENSFRDYLFKLNEVSNMEQCGMYYDKDTQSLYVFARTHAAPYNYYFRTASNTSPTTDAWIWTPWEQVQLDIKSIDAGENSGVHLMPVIWKKRLFLFWPEFMEKTVTSSNNSSNYKDLAYTTSPNDNVPKKYWEIRLSWSEYANSKWTPKKLSKEVLSPLYSASGSIAPTLPRQYFFRSTIHPDDSLDQTLYLRYKKQPTKYTFEKTDNNDAISVGQFHFLDIEGKLTASDFITTTKLTDLGNHGKAINDQYQIDKNIFDTPSNFYTPYFESLTRINALALSNTDFLQKIIDHKILFSNNITIPDFENKVNNPFFYTDTNNNRTYFVAPSGNNGYSTTIGRPIVKDPNPIFSGFKNKINAPLSLYNPKINSTTVQLKSVRLSKVLQPAEQNVSKDLASQETVKASFGQATAESSTTTSFQTQAPPTVNNFDKSVVNLSAIGQIVSKGASIIGQILLLIFRHLLAGK